jgi:hypothetical protein
MNDNDLKLLLDHKDKIIETQQQMIKRKDHTIQAQKETIDYLWALVESKQDKLDAHKNQLSLKI